MSEAQKKFTTTLFAIQAVPTNDVYKKYFVTKAEMVRKTFNPISCLVLDSEEQAKQICYNHNTKGRPTNYHYGVVPIKLSGYDAELAIKSAQYFNKNRIIPDELTLMRTE